MHKKMYLGLATTACFIAGSVLASPGFTDEDIQSILSGAQEIQDNAEAVIGGFEPGRPDVEQHQADFDRIHDRSAEAVQERFNEWATEDLPATPSEVGQARPERTLIAYVSSSLSNQELREIAEMLHAAPYPGVLVFRGINDGERINDFSTRVAPIVDGLEDRVGVHLDPTRFQDARVQAVPRIALQDEHERIIAHVDGLTSPSWMLERVEQGKSGDLGRQGPVEEIAEQDLIELMQERMAAVDWGAERDRTIESFWERVDMLPLPAAQDDETRYHDPSVLVQSDIKDAHGDVLVAAGTIINPLELRSFNRRLIVIDPTSQAQLNWLAELPDAPGKKDILVASELDREIGWEGFADLQAEIGRELYLLKPEVRSSFQIRATPSVVTANNGRFVIREHHVPEEVTHVR